MRGGVSELLGKLDVLDLEGLIEPLLLTLLMLQLLDHRRLLLKLLSEASEPLVHKGELLLEEDGR